MTTARLDAAMLPSANKKGPNKSLTPDVPHELVATHILVHLPVRSLLRFRCVCKAWNDTIGDDSFFIRAHLRVQNLSLLVAPLTKNSNDDDRGGTPETNVVTTIAGLYHMSQPGGAATPLHDMADYGHLLFPGRRDARDLAHRLAHCDGLVLVPTDAMVIVLNPATRRVLTLPSTPHAVRPRRLPPCVRAHQAFGFGHDPRSNSNKVARFFYCDDKDGYRCTLGMEVFTLKTDKHWRETAVPPPYPIMAGRTSTFFRGSLLWTPQVSLLASPPGFIRFNLEDESFSITPPPPLCGLELDYAASRLAELRGELCLCVNDKRRDRCRTLEMWMCADLDTNEPTRWERRYIIRYALFAVLPHFQLIAMLDDKLVFQAGSHQLVFDDCWNGEGFYKDRVNLKYKMYRNAEDESKHRRMLVDYFDAIPYVASLVPI